MKLINSFKYAVAGFLHCVKHERNFRIHLIAAALVILLAVSFELAAFEVITLVFAIALVLICEMINTAIERAIDAINECGNVSGAESDKLDELRKIAKDIAAGAVFVSAIFAAIIGFIIFADRIYDLVWRLMA